LVAPSVINNLPGIDDLLKRSQSLAMLDAIMSPQWEYRYYSFNAHWAERKMMASMRNGSGDDYFILFNQFGAAIKGFDHESEMSPYRIQRVWPGILNQVPHEFDDFLHEPSFSMQDTTFCLWRRADDDCWQTGTINYPSGNQESDGSSQLLVLLLGGPDRYQKWAQQYFERTVDIHVIESIYDHHPINEIMIRQIDPTNSLSKLQPDIHEIAYPSVMT
jgi:hypothetical protein